MNTSKIIKAYIGAGTYSTTESITQGDYGYILQIEGAELPAIYRVDFSNDRHDGEALPVYGNENGAEVPKELIDTGKDIFAFYYYIGENFGKTAYTWKIPNDTRAKNGDREPTPTQQDSIDQLIVRSNEVVDRAEDAEQAIENMSVSAQTLAEGASATVTKTESEGVVHLEFGIPRGATGAQGDKGDKGDKGDTGAQGAKGDKGDKGDTGATGAKGDKGDKGEKGDKGDTGEVTQAEFDELSGEVTDLKENLTTIPSIKDSDADEGVFDLTDTQGNVILRLADGHVKTQNFNSSALTESGFEWKFSGTDLLLGYGYNDTYDAVMVINVGRANDLLDFSKLCLKPKGTALETLETADLTTVWGSGTDMHGPFQFLVTSNADGYYSESTDPNFTGGNHTVSIDGTAVKSASSKYVHYFADGRPVSSGNGYCNHFEIRWANEVQAYNCVKADGTGRASLTEYHDMIFDGVRFTEDIKLVPSEEITMRLWYGLQTVSIGTSYTNISFVDGTNRQIFASSESNINSGNNTTSGFRAWGNTHAMEMTVDTNIDLGKRPMYTGTKGAFASSSKGYFYIIGSGNTLSANCEYNLRGSFRFYPVVA